MHLTSIIVPALRILHPIPLIHAHHITHPGNADRHQRTAAKSVMQYAWSIDVHGVHTLCTSLMMQDYLAVMSHRSTYSIMLDVADPVIDTPRLSGERG